MADEPELIEAPTWVTDGRIRGRCLKCGATTLDHDATPEGEQQVVDLMQNHHQTRHTVPDAPGE